MLYSLQINFGFFFLFFHINILWHGMPKKNKKNKKIKNKKNYYYYKRFT